MRLDNKIAVVTGGGGGLGEAMCERLAEEGAAVAVTDVSLPNAERVAEQLLAKGARAVAIQHDVTDEQRWPAVLAEVEAALGNPNVLVNNAGIAVISTVEDETLAGWRKTQAVNLDAVFMGTQAAIATMKESGGSIINISSIEGIIGEPRVPAYNASKGGVRIFSKSAALHCAKNGYPVRVNSIHPGYVGTAMVQCALATLSEEEGNALFAELMGKIPMGRLGEPVEIANGVVFLASDEASYITGSELVIDGGYTAA